MGHLNLLITEKLNIYIYICWINLLQIANGRDYLMLHGRPQDVLIQHFTQQNLPQTSMQQQQQHQQLQVCHQP